MGREEAVEQRLAGDAGVVVGDPQAAQAGADVDLVRLPAAPAEQEVGAGEPHLQRGLGQDEGAQRLGGAQPFHRCPQVTVEERGGIVAYRPVQLPRRLGEQPDIGLVERDGQGGECHPVVRAGLHGGTGAQAGPDLRQGRHRRPAAVAQPGVELS
ncbi:hypothetical protein OIM90_26580 [Streptomyces sp. AD16]|nr:hypothetical protein OIM90_26580 [Streptomyces sp. AD16]